MTDRLGADQIARLQSVKRGLSAMSADVRAITEDGGRALADLIRRELPDLDDLTLGRVVLQIGLYVGLNVHCMDDERDQDVLMATGNYIVAAALDLTAAEWDSPEASQA